MLEKLANQRLEKLVNKRDPFNPRKTRSKARKTSETTKSSKNWSTFYQKHPYKRREEKARNTSRFRPKVEQNY